MPSRCGEKFANVFFGCSGFALERSIDTFVRNQNAAFEAESFTQCSLSRHEGCRIVDADVFIVEENLKIGLHTNQNITDCDLCRY
jgi:hypothetical protein